jgi:DNA repair protein RadC
MTHDPILPPSRESLLEATILRGTDSLTDAMVLSGLLQPGDIARAETILQEAGSLDLLQRMGPIELAALGLKADEVARLMVATEFAARALRRSGRRTLNGLTETVKELRLRAQAWPRSLVGIIGVEADYRVIRDKVIFEGTQSWVPLDLPELLRDGFRAGCKGLLVYRWTPQAQVQVTAEDRRIADELRVMGSILGIELVDYLVIAEQSYWTGRCDDGWA